MEIDQNPSHHNIVPNSDQVMEEESEEVLVYVNFEDLNDDYSDADLNELRILGLETDEPILQIGDKTFGGNWKETVGTAVFFKETAPVPKRCYFSADVPKPLKYAAKTRKMLNFKRIFVSSKEETSTTKHSKVAETENNVEINNEKESDTDMREQQE